MGSNSNIAVGMTNQPINQALLDVLESVIWNVKMEQWLVWAEAIIFADKSLHKSELRFQ